MVTQSQHCVGRGDGRGTDQRPGSLRHADLAKSGSSGLLGLSLAFTSFFLSWAAKLLPAEIGRAFGFSHDFFIFLSLK
jgi:hypothetical protein